MKLTNKISGVIVLALMTACGSEASKKADTANTGTGSETGKGNETTAEETAVQANGAGSQKGPMKLSLSGAVGLARVKSSGAGFNLIGDDSKNNLRTVSEDGELKSAWANGSNAKTEQVLAADDQLFLRFEGKPLLGDSDAIKSSADQAAIEAYTKSACALASANPDSGELTCVDSTVAKVSDMKISQEGTLFYKGELESKEGVKAAQVVRAVVGDKVVSFSQPNVTVSDFAPGEDAIIMIGADNSVKTTFIRRINSQGQVQNIANSAEAETLRQVAPNKWLIGNMIYDDADQSYVRYTNRNDDLLTEQGVSPLPSSLHDVSSLCASAVKSYFCGEGVNEGDKIKTNYFSLENGDQIVIGRNAFDQLYPTPMHYNHTFSEIHGSAVVSNDSVVLFGPGSDGNARLSLYSLSSQTEEALIAAGEYTFSMVAATSTTVMFSATKMSDSSLVTGTIDLSTKEVSVKAAADTLDSIEALK